MMRPLTLFTMLLAAGSGAYLFAVKHEAQVLDDQLAAIAQASRLDAQRIRVLQAQWALEIDPTRVGQLAARFTALQPMKPAQLVTLASLQAALPPPGSAAPGDNPAAGAVPDFAPQPAMLASNALPMPPAPPPASPAQAKAPAMVASASTVHAPHLVAQRPARHHTPPAPQFAAMAPPRPAAQFAAVAPPRPAAQFAAVAPPRPAWQNAVQPAPAGTLLGAPMGAQVVSVKAESLPAMQNSDTGSALGMAADLAPPRPLPAGNGN